ncbi:MAG: hypothetical protein WBV82_27410 [Myxococcaceae bacterium]
MGIRNDLKNQALSLSQMAMEKLMADEKRAIQIASAIGKVQKGKQALEKGQDDVLRSLNFAVRGDFKALGKRFASLKRRIRELDEKLEEVAARR